MYKKIILCYRSTPVYKQPTDTQVREENHTLGKKYTERMTEDKRYLRGNLMYHILCFIEKNYIYIYIHTHTKAWNLQKSA